MDRPEILSIRLPMQTGQSGLGAAIGGVIASFFTVFGLVGVAGLGTSWIMLPMHLAGVAIGGIALLVVLAAAIVSAARDTEPPT